MPNTTLFVSGALEIPAQANAKHRLFLSAALEIPAQANAKHRLFLSAALEFDQPISNDIH